MKKKDDFEIKIFISLQDSTCSECGENLGRKAWITLSREKGSLCLSCADLDHLIFLPSGDDNSNAVTINGKINVWKI